MGEPRYTEKEMVMAQREAFTDGAVCWAGQVRDDRLRVGGGTFVTLANIKADAHTKYPLPRIERPRVVTDASGDTWRISDDWLQRRPADRDEWDIVMSLKDASRREGLQEILAHPSEFVDDEG